MSAIVSVLGSQARRPICELRVSAELKGLAEGYADDLRADGLRKRELSPKPEPASVSTTETWKGYADAM